MLLVFEDRPDVLFHSARIRVITVISDRNPVRADDLVDSLDLADYLAIAERSLDIPAETLLRGTRTGIAGLTLLGMTTCPNCGHENEAGANAGGVKKRKPRRIFAVGALFLGIPALIWIVAGN